MCDKNECTNKIAYDLPVKFCVVKSTLIKIEMIQVSFEFLNYLNENLILEIICIKKVVIFCRSSSDGALIEP